MFKGVVVPKFVGLIFSVPHFLLNGLNISDSLNDRIAEFS